MSYRLYSFKCIDFPEGGKATVNLSSVKGDLDVEWFIPATNQTLPGPRAIKGGYFANFVAPFIGDAVLYLKKK